LPCPDFCNKNIKIFVPCQVLLLKYNLDICRKLRAKKFSPYPGHCNKNIIHMHIKLRVKKFSPGEFPVIKKIIDIHIKI